jgi:hypothetical protein
MVNDYALPVLAVGLGLALALSWWSARSLAQIRDEVAELTAVLDDLRLAVRGDLARDAEQIGAHRRGSDRPPDRVWPGDTR